MTEQLETALIDEPMNQTLVALTPAELVPAQRALSDWCTNKIKALEAEFTDLAEHQQIAAANGWKLRGLTNSLNRTAKRVTYYEKIKAAVDAGYLVVPNMPVEVFAVRVNREKQPERTTNSKWSRHISAEAQVLPQGQGRYVDDQVFTEDRSYEHTTPEGKKESVSLYVSGAYDEVDFPVRVAAPVVLDATGKAMALKLFDEMGMVVNTGSRDPIIVGRILDPRGNDRCATFFVAWWLNTKDL